MMSHFSLAKCSGNSDGQEISRPSYSQIDLTQRATLSRKVQRQFVDDALLVYLAQGQMQAPQKPLLDTQGPICTKCLLV